MNEAERAPEEGSARELGLFPWQSETWRRVIQPALERRELHHGLLIVGARGLGKGRLADVLCAALLCQDPGSLGLPCGRCRGCHLFATAAHPDVTRIETDSGSIGIDQVRGLSRNLNLSSQYGGARVGIVDPADRLTVNAANSLLKTLEEPPAGAHVLLLASQPSRLPATVRSRCQLIRITAPPEWETRAWLAEQPNGEAAARVLPLAGGAPLAALRMAADGDAESLERLTATLEAVATGRMDAVRAAANWKEKGAAQQLVGWVEILMMDLARAAAAGPEQLRIWDPVRIRAFQRALLSEPVQSFLTWLGETRRGLEQPLNDQLVAEELFIRWRRLMAGR